jgi:hypothetical protein
MFKSVETKNNPLWLVLIIIALMFFAQGSHAGEVEWNMYAVNPISDNSDLLEFKNGIGVEFDFKNKTGWLAMLAYDINPVEHESIGSLDNLNLIYLGAGKEWSFKKYWSIGLKGGYVKSHDSTMEKTSYSTAYKNIYPAKMQPYNKFIPRCIQNKLPPVSIASTVIDITKVKFGDGYFAMAQVGFNYNFKGTKWYLGFNPGARYKNFDYEVSNNLRGKIEDDNMEVIDWVLPFSVRLNF